MIDVDGLRRGEPIDPFAALVDQQAGDRLVDVSGDCTVSERVARSSKAWIRAAA